MNSNNMPSAKISILTRMDILATAKAFHWNRQLPKWTVIIEGRELPARPLILKAAGVPPNDPTNSHQAVAILAEQGFDIRYEGKALPNENHNPAEQAVLLDLIDSLCGCCKGDGLIQDREREHRIEEDRWPQ